MLGGFQLNSYAYIYNEESEERFVDVLRVAAADYESRDLFIESHLKPFAISFGSFFIDKAFHCRLSLR